MPISRIRALLCALSIVCVSLATGQEYPPISAASLTHLKSQARIDFADVSGALEIGWFEARADGGEFIVFDSKGRVYRVSEAGVKDSWTYVEPGSGRLFSLIDAAYLDAAPHILYVLGERYLINERQLPTGFEPLAVVAHSYSLFIEAIDADGRPVFLSYALGDAGAGWELVDEFSLPEADPEKPTVRIGRIDFPIVLYSSLADSALTVYRFPGAFMGGAGREFSLMQGPAVFGAVNATGSHFAWSDPGSARLNLLDLQTGENRVVAEIGSAYAQYHLLTADASAILVVNLNFAPAIFAWDVQTGKRHDLGAYRECERIPDKVALSADGTALIIGCDTGLDIWRVEISSDREED